MVVRHIGRFPPPYGGVSIKNKLLYDTISQYVPVKKLKQRRWMSKRIYEVLEILSSFLPNQKLIIGISASTGKSKKYTQLLYLLARNNMKRSLYFMMGGTEASRIAENDNEISLYGNYKVIYVETISMLRKMRDVGMSNIELFPNCRKKPGYEIIEDVSQEKLKCVFFSNIHPMKGVDTIIETASECPNIDFYFYGEIDSKYMDDFLGQINGYSNCTYMGVFKGKGDSLYKELSKYDVLLLPTRYKTEGVPGVVVESKMAGIPSILSDVSHNRDLIEGEDGWILNSNSASELIEILNTISQDRSLLNNMKSAALASASNYDIQTYTNKILASLGVSGNHNGGGGIESFGSSSST